MTNKMFKIGSFEAELLDSMQKKLLSNQLDNNYSVEKISKAADYINAAAELLDDTGFNAEATVLTKILQKLAGESVDLNDTSDITEEDLKALENPQDPTELKEVIIEPLEQDIKVDSKKPGSFPLNVDYRSGEIFESPEYLEFESIAAKMAANRAKKKV